MKLKNELEFQLEKGDKIRREEWDKDQYFVYHAHDWTSCEAGGAARTIVGFLHNAYTRRPWQILVDSPHKDWVKL
jgi:hypothetical protein